MKKTSYVIQATCLDINKPDMTGTKTRSKEKGERNIMRKKKLFASAVIAAMAAVQVAMPTMAAETNNSQEKLDNSNSYTQEQLTADGHTTFSVFESENEVSI